METYSEHNHSGTVILKLKYKSQHTTVTDISLPYSLATQTSEMSKSFPGDKAMGSKTCWEAGTAHAKALRLSEHGLRTSLTAQRVKRLSAMQETQVWSLGWEDPLEKEMAAHSSILAWKIPWTWSLVGYHPWGRKESDTTERLHTILINCSFKASSTLTRADSVSLVNFLLELWLGSPF